MASHREFRFGLLALVTYGLVFLFTGLAIGTYYYLDARREGGGQSDVADTRTVQVGAIWVPAYPGAALRPPEVATREDLVDGKMDFTTSDPAAQVISYFQSILAQTGYQVMASPSGESPNNLGGGTVQAIRQGGRLRIVVTVEAARAGSDVSIRTLARTERK